MLRRGWTHTIRRWCAITQGCMRTCLIYNANIFFYCGNGADCAKPRCLISVFDRGSCELSLRRPGDSPPVNAVKQNRSPTWKHSFRESKCCLLFTRSSKTALKQMATGHKSWHCRHWNVQEKNQFSIWRRRAEWNGERVSVLLSPRDVLLDAVEAALRVISAHIRQVERKRLQFTGIFWAGYWDFLLKTKRKNINVMKSICHRS